MDEMRAILDSLMGADRNSVVSLDGSSKITFKNSDVCHFYLLDFCPHDLFPNTKSDLGPCPKKHSDAFREQFLADPDHDYYARRYEREFIDSLQRLVDGVEQRIRKGNERILGPDESRLEQDKQRKVDALKQEISQLLAQAQEAGENGNIAEAEALTRKTTEVRCSLDRLNSTSTNYLASLSAQEKSLRVCPVCGAMQSLGDAASRFESHVTGKQHVGYERIRATLVTLRAKHGISAAKNGARGQPELGPASSRNTDQDDDDSAVKKSGDEASAAKKDKNGTQRPSRSASRTKRSLSTSRSRRSGSENYSRRHGRPREGSLSRESTPDRHSASRYSSRYRSGGPEDREERSRRNAPRRRRPLSPRGRSPEYRHSKYYGSRHRDDAYGEPRSGDYRYGDYHRSGGDYRSGDYRHRTSDERLHKKRRSDMSDRRREDLYESGSRDRSRPSRGVRDSDRRDRSSEDSREGRSAVDVSKVDPPRDADLPSKEE